MIHLDEEENNDNRNYDYSNFPDVNRIEYDTVAEQIFPNSTVIDLGCGNGSLLKKIITERNAKGKGIEISASGVEACKRKNLDVLQAPIDSKLPFDDDSFDYSICNVTIQMVNYPEILLTEMKRISKFQIISFPNFAFYKNRFDLLFNGRMPHPMIYGYSWYNTGHIHQLSIKDFHYLINKIGGFEVQKIIFPKTSNNFKNIFMKKFPNLFAPLPVFLLIKK